MNIPPSYICYSPTGLSLPLPLIYRRAQLRKFIDAPHILHKHVLWLQTSRKDLTWPKENSPTWRSTHRLLSEVIGAIHACPEVDQSVASSLHPRYRCKVQGSLLLLQSIFVLDFIVSYHLLLFHRCKVEQSLLLLQSIFVLDIWGGGRFSVCYHCLLEDIWAKTTNIECFHNKGRFRLPTNWMNFQKNSKWPLTHPLFSDFFFIMVMAAYMPVGMRTR